MFIFRAALIALWVSGCARTISIQPRTLPHLNGAWSQAVPVAMYGGAGQPIVQYAERKSQILARTPQGDPVIIKGAFEVRITTSDGQVLSYPEPILSRVHGDALWVAGRDQPVRRLPAVDRLTVEVVQPGSGQAVLYGGLILAAVAAIIVVGADDP
jgi:hypothetical protein